MFVSIGCPWHLHVESLVCASIWLWLLVCLLTGFSANSVGHADQSFKQLGVERSASWNGICWLSTGRSTTPFHTTPTYIRPCALACQLADHVVVPGETGYWSFLRIITMPWHEGSSSMAFNLPATCRLPAVQ